jgi:hypothetical protein
LCVVVAPVGDALEGVPSKDAGWPRVDV